MCSLPVVGSIPSPQGLGWLGQSNFSPAVSSPLPSPSGSVRYLLFVDISIPDYQSLVRSAAPDTEVVCLDPSQDAISQITQTLLTRASHSIARIELLSHGQAGELQWGDRAFSLANLANYAEQLLSWRNVLTVDADILLYGCNLAANFLGQTLVQLVSQMTGADVAASTNLTGAAGDWDLEYQVGTIATDHFSCDSYGFTLEGTTGPDFDGNGTADYLWRNINTGANQLWLFNGVTSVSTVPLPNKTTNWRILGTDDLDGDGDIDVVWRNSTTNTLSVWWMNRTQLVSETTIGRPATGWSFSGLADFDADGDADLLWRNFSTGQTSLWLLNLAGSSVTYQNVALDQQLDSAWFIAGIGDLDGNGNNDILWRNSLTSDTRYWQVNAVNFQVSSVALGQRDRRIWTVLGVSDVDGDGDADVLWQRNVENTTRVFIETYQTGQPISIQTIRDINPGWGEEVFADLDGDGLAEIGWRFQTTGSNALWRLNRSSDQITYRDSPALPSLSSDWALEFFDRKTRLRPAPTTITPTAEIPPPTTITPTAEIPAPTPATIATI